MGEKGIGKFAESLLRHIGIGMAEEAISEKDSLSAEETATMRTLVAEAGFDPSENIELTRKMLLHNDRMTNRIICSHPAVNLELRLMVIKNGLQGSQEAILRPDEACQRAAIETGDGALLGMVAGQPNLSEGIQKLLLDQCFILKKSEDYSKSYDNSAIKFGALHQLMDNPDYKPGFGREIAATLMQTQHGSPYIPAREICGHGHYAAGAELMLRLASSPFLDKDTWEKMTRVTLGRILKLGAPLRWSKEKEYNYQAAIRAMDPAVSTLLELLNHPRLEEILQSNPSFRLEEVIQYDGVSDAGDNAWFDLRFGLGRLNEQQRRSFDQLAPERRRALPHNWEGLLYEPTSKQ